MEMVRYADDFVILCRTKEEAKSALSLVREWVRDNGLSLHEANFLSKLQLTPEQESSIQAIYADLAGKYGLKEPPKQVQAVLFVRVLPVLTHEQRKQALVLIRDQERQKELDAKATKRSMQNDPEPMKSEPMK